MWENLYNTPVIIFENVEEIHDFLVKYKLPKLIQKKKKI